MKTYKTFITLHNDRHILKEYSEEEIKKAGNINYLVLGNYVTAKRIQVLMFNENTGKYYSELTFDRIIENWKNSHSRIERTNPEGYGDYTGYGARTEGKKNRFYIGKSTGWIPIYLEILTNRSFGGGALFWKKGTFRRVY